MVKVVFLLRRETTTSSRRRQPRLKVFQKLCIASVERHFDQDIRLQYSLFPVSRLGPTELPFSGFLRSHPADHCQVRVIIVARHVSQGLSRSTQIQPSQ